MQAQPKLETPREEEHLPEAVFSSLAFPALLKVPSGRVKPRILDLGNISERNITFLARHTSKIFLEDSLCNLVAMPRPRSSHESLRELELLGKNAAIDIVLCWDLLSYLEPEEIVTFGKTLEKICRPGTDIFWLRSQHKFMPKFPGRYSIVGPTTLAYQPSSSEFVARKGPSKTLLQKLLPQFPRKRSFLLRHGMEEHIHVFKG